MDTIETALTRTQPTYAAAFEQMLSPQALRDSVPAAFASGAHERTSKAYTFISTERVLTALGEAGFLPVEARQTTTRTASPVHARHLIRLRRRCETVQLREAVPELLFLNSHDGTGAYLMLISVCHH